MKKVGSNEKASNPDYKLGGITGKGFMPGVSGNPEGKKKNPLKDFSMKEFESWSDYEKKAFLEKIAPIDRWRMTEGNPHQTVDSKIEGDINIQGVEVTIRK